MPKRDALLVVSPLINHAKGIATRGLEAPTKATKDAPANRVASEYKKTPSDVPTKDAARSHDQVPDSHSFTFEEGEREAIMIRTKAANGKRIKLAVKVAVPSPDISPTSLKVQSVKTMPIAQEIEATKEKIIGNN